MSTALFRVKSLYRVTRKGAREEITFTDGVNLIVGPPNSGKTMWLEMLDHILGDRDSVVQALGHDMAEKYVAAGAIVLIDSAEYILERRWDYVGDRQKIFVDGRRVPDVDFSDFWLDLLRMPKVKFPQGDARRNDLRWRDLPWRSIWHHLYRKQKRWTDIADRQPESEQFSCLVQLLGQAEHLFAPELGRIADLQDAKRAAEARKEQLVGLLNESARTLLLPDSIAAGVTEKALDEAVASLTARIDELQIQRDVEVEAAARQTASPENAAMVAELSDEWSKRNAVIQDENASLTAIDARIAELQQYDQTLDNELERLRRATAAGRLLSDLKVTHCPACDKPIPSRNDDKNRCYVCKQTTETVEESSDTAAARLQFERDHILAERGELAQLLGQLTEDRTRIAQQVDTSVAELNRLDNTLSSLRRSSGAVTTAAVTAIDMEIGRLNERAIQANHLRRFIRERDAVSMRLDDMDSQISRLTERAERRKQKLALQRASDLLADAMNDYVRSLNEPGHRRWTQSEIGLVLRPRGFTFLVGGKPWQHKLGGSLTLYFLLAYHYGLLAISNHETCNSPGIVVLDFPPNLEEGVDVKDKENYILAPFVELLGQIGGQGRQVIAAGSAFEGLQVANRVQLRRVWR